MSNNELIKALGAFVPTPPKIFYYVKYDSNGELLGFTDEKDTSENIIRIGKDTMEQLKWSILSDWEIIDGKIKRKQIKNLFFQKYAKIGDCGENEIGTICLDDNMYWPSEKVFGKGKIWKNL